MDIARRLVVLGSLAVAAGGCSGELAGTPSPSPSQASSMTSPATGTSAIPPGGTALVVELVYVPVCGPSDPFAEGCDPRPLPDVRVDVWDARSVKVGEGFTDESGTASFDLPPGDYVVRPSAVPSAATPRPAAVAVPGAGSVTATIRYESNLQ